MPKNKKEKPEGNKQGLKEKVSEMFELPKEIVLDIPKITILGTKSLVIENYKGIFEYSEAKVRINTGSGIIKIEGTKLEIKEVTSEEIAIEGAIQKVEFV